MYEYLIYSYKAYKFYKIYKTLETLSCYTKTVYKFFIQHPKKIEDDEDDWIEIVVVF